MSNGSPEENLKQIFRVFDINNDGSISLKVNIKVTALQIVACYGGSIMCTFQELQRIVKDLFHLINEKNADMASQEVLAEAGQ
jgi:Ca2+-binding EF-hand superfamily protein